MGVDDHRDRLVSDGLDLVQERLPPAGVFRIDDHHFRRGDEHGAVSPAAAHHVEVVLQLVDFDHTRCRLARGWRRLLSAWTEMVSTPAANTMPSTNCRLIEPL
jgi:hypothetical protein